MALGGPGTPPRRRGSEFEGFCLPRDDFRGFRALATCQEVEPVVGVGIRTEGGNTSYYECGSVLSCLGPARDDRYARSCAVAALYKRTLKPAAETLGARLGVSISLQSRHALVPTLAPGVAHGSRGKELPRQPLPAAVRSCYHGSK